jgi:hypothetical protein
MMIINAETTMMLLLPHLTPKQAIPLTASCKGLYSQRKVCDTMSAETYTRLWAKEYAKLFVSVEYSIFNIGRLLVCEYPEKDLLNSTVSIFEVAKKYAGSTSKTTNGDLLQDFHHEINFFKMGSKVVPIFTWYNINNGAKAHHQHLS